MRSIQQRISISSGLAVVSAVAVLSGTGAYFSYTTAVRSASANALDQARLHSATVKTEIQGALDAAHAIAGMLASNRNPRNPLPLSRPQVIAILEETARNNPTLLATYTAWEPGAYDGQDASFAGAAGHDKTGRFLPYLVRGPGGAIGLEPLTDLENQDRGPTGVRKGEYYLCAKETSSECVVNPYPYDVQGKTVLMTSAVVPIVINGRFQGIAGVDIALDTLQQRMNSVELNSGADRIAIISQNGRIVAAKERPELAGKPAAEYHPGLTDGALRGSDRVARSGNDLLALAPAPVSRTGPPWTLAVMVPYSIATAGAWQLVVWQVGIGLAVAAVSILLIVVVLAGNIKRALLTVVNDLREGARQVAVAARQISGASRSLAEGSSAQAAALEETSASTTQIDSMAASNTKNADAASALVDTSNRSVEETSRKLSQMVESMSSISASSSKISNIIGTIDNIAFQTNILALNAAVEAARAREAGAGFAVVADEVRNLALRCAQAARETATLIEESIQNANAGRLRVDSVVEAVNAFTVQTAQVKTLVDEVASGSKEQASGVEQIGRAVHEMETVTQRVAASAQEYASASHEIEAQTRAVETIVERLEELVGIRAESR